MSAQSKWPPPEDWHGLDDPYIQLAILMLIAFAIVAALLGVGFAVIAHA